MKGPLQQMRTLAAGPIGKIALATVASRIANVALGFIVTLALARLLGVKGYGAFAYAVSATMMIALIGRLGFDLLLVRKIPEFRATKNWDSLSALLRFVLSAAVVATAIFAALFWSAQTLIGGAAERFSDSAVIFAAATAPALTLTFLAQGALRGFQKPFAFAPQFLIVQVLMIASVAILQIAGALTLTSILAAHLIAWACAAAVGWIWTVREAPKVSRHPIPPDARAWMRTSLLMLACNFSVFAAGSIEIIALGVAADAASAGVYAVALRFAQFILFPAFAISAGLAPKIAEFHGGGAKAQIADRLRKSAIYATAGAWLFAPVAAGAFFLGLNIMGAEFSAAAPLLVIMAAGYLAGVTAGCPLDVLLMTGREKAAATVSLNFTAATIAACVAVIPSYGAIGAAFITSSLFAVQQWTLSLCAARLCGIRTDIFAISRSRRTATRTAL